MGIRLTVHGATGCEIFAGTYANAEEATEVLVKIMVENDRCSATLEPEDDPSDGENLSRRILLLSRSLSRGV